VELRDARDAAEAANRAKDRFLAVLSHELRTPLSPVVMTIAAMENDPNLPYSMRDDVRMIRRNIELETKLIDDLLDLSRVASGKLRLQMQPTSVHDLLQHIVETCAGEFAANRLQVKLELRAANDQVIGDRARLQQVFWNLIRNAIKFTPIGGAITLSSESIDEVTMRVQVRDTGVGIAPDVLPRLFNAFEQGEESITRKFGGLGLGLAIAKAVLDLHGGTLTAASEGAGHGAVFIVELMTAHPTRASSDEPGQASRGAAAAQPQRCGRILLVEDHADSARALAKLLGACGYVVKTAHTVAAALDLAAAVRPADQRSRSARCERVRADGIDPRAVRHEGDRAERLRDGRRPQAQPRRGVQRSRRQAGERRAARGGHSPTARREAVKTSPFRRRNRNATCVIHLTWACVRKFVASAILLAKRQQNAHFCARASVTRAGHRNRRQTSSAPFGVAEWERHSARRPAR
jgi:hypothetical protein